MRWHTDGENDGVDAPGYDVLMCLLLSVHIEEPWLQAAAKDQKGNVASLPAEYEIIQFRSLDIYSYIYRFLQPETSTCPSTTDLSSPHLSDISSTDMFCYCATLACRKMNSYNYPQISPYTYMWPYAIKQQRVIIIFSRILQNFTIYYWYRKDNKTMFYFYTDKMCFTVEATGP